ncbi:hypothetical protein D3C77_354510 [compost metagenome]
MEGLLNEIVGSQLHGHNHIRRMVARRQENNRHVGMGANHPAPMKSVELRQLDINNDEIRLHRCELLHDAAEILNAIYFIAPLLQPFPNFAK